MTVNAEIRLNARVDEKGSGDLGTPQKIHSLAVAQMLINGTTEGKANLVFSDQRTISASGSENLDLAGGLTDAFGNAITFVEIVAIIVRAAAGNTNNVEVGGAASNAFATPFGDASDVVVIPPGGLMVLMAPNTGWGVTASTGDLLKIANSGGTTGVTYDILILGRDA